MDFAEESELLGLLVVSGDGDRDGLVDDGFVVLGASLMLSLDFVKRNASM